MALVALAACEKPVPENPTFAGDVQPIFEAHCVRCHGAGGMLNADPHSIPSTFPTGGFLDQYDDTGDCTPDPTTGAIPLSCERGARHEADIGYIKGYLHDYTPRMPPAPSPPLTPWELAVVDNWLAEQPPLR
jgi:hypothetical protein